MDRAGLGTLMSSYATLTGTATQLTPLNVSAGVKDLLLITKLHTVFAKLDNDAIDSFLQEAATAYGRA